jgi:hypothetical protein
MKIQKAFLKSMVLFIALSAIIGIFSVLTGSFGKLQGIIFVTTISLGVYSLTGLCCVPMLERPELRALGVCGIAASILGGAFAMLTNFLLLVDFSFNDAFLILIGRFAFLIIAISIAHISLLMRITTNQPLVIITRRCTIAAIGVVALSLLSMLFSLDMIGEAWFLLIIFGILDVAGTIGTPILHAIMKNQSG